MQIGVSAGGADRRSRSRMLLRSAVFTLLVDLASCFHPSATCSSLAHASLGQNTTVLSASIEKTEEAASSIEYCLVKVLVLPAINIWVGLPSDGSWNSRFMALGGGGFVGSVSEPTAAVKYGYAGATTDTGHKGSSGSFGMLRPGVPDMQLRVDFGWRSEHHMALVGKALISSYYGKPPVYSYWNGCSTGGRQGQAMAQRFPDDYDGILAGAPAVHFEKLGLGQTWPQVPMLMENHGKAVGYDNEVHAVSEAVKACDALDGVVDGVLRDPRACNYSARALVSSGHLTAGEAKAIDEIWRGARGADGSLLWYGIPRGASLSVLAGSQPFSIPVGQAKYWVELDPSWDYRSLTYDNFPAFFDKTVRVMEPGPTATDNPESISAFRDAGHKLLMWHGWADQIIMPQGSIDYYNQVVDRSDHGNLTATQEWFRFFMAPGVAHCGMDTSPYFEALVDWVEKGVAPERILHRISAKTTRPLCPHPTVAVYKGGGSTGDPDNFVCGTNPVGPDTEDCDARVNQRLFGKPFVPSAPCPGC